jgi:pSer/pThr/pTyr-binding forkhead associated (FHA) protein
MAKLTLQFEGRVLKTLAVEQGVTIGRLPDNAVVIDNPAVSGHHARIVRDGDRLVLEDLQSTNGTFVNDHHIYRHVLRHGDVVLVGKHQLLFESSHAADAFAAEPALAPLGDTVYLDTKRHRALLASLRALRAEADLAAGAVPTVSVPPVATGIGILRVLSGDTEQTEYELGSRTCLIGKASTALVRLRGWFKPDVAAAIARNGDGYVVTRFGGRTRVNSVPVRGQHHLRDGDVLSVGGLTLEFRMRAAADHAMAVMSEGQRSATVRALT